MDIYCRDALKGLAWLALAGCAAMPAAAQDTAPAAPLAAPVCVDAPAPTQYVMPTTGVTFSLLADPGCIPSPPPPMRPPAPNLFHMAAVPVGTNPSLAKWEHARIGGSLAEQAGPWSELLGEANRVARGNPFVMVNSWVNWHVRYREEAGDNWADALTTLRRGYGDCEDFVLAKVALLSALGVSSDDMFLVLLRDARGADHAVLAVRRAGGFYILDNRTDKLLSAELVTDYTPVLSFSGEFAWMYGKRAG